MRSQLLHLILQIYSHSTPLLNFDLVTAIIPAPSQNIIINTMEQWDIISLLPTWLQLSSIISGLSSGSSSNSSKLY
jgi:hypothetical protein